MIRNFTTDYVKRIINETNRKIGETIEIHFECFAKVLVRKTESYSDYKCISISEEIYRDDQIDKLIESVSDSVTNDEYLRLIYDLWEKIFRGGVKV